LLEQGVNKMFGVILLLFLLSGLSFALLIDGLSLRGRAVPHGLRWIRLGDHRKYSKKAEKPGPFPWACAGMAAFFLLVGILILTGLTILILYVLLAAVAVGAVAAVIGVILLFLFTILVTISAIVFAAEFRSARKQKRPKHAVPEKSKRKPKRKNEWLQRDSV
jgi:hypothetical protein